MKSDEYTVADERLGIGSGKTMEKEEINQGYGGGLGDRFVVSWNDHIEIY